MSGEHGDAKGGAEKALSFFRAFDVAFLAPGTLVFASLLFVVHGTSDAHFELPPEVNNIGPAIAYGVGALTAIFTLGLATHAVQEQLLGPRLRTSDARDPKHSWFAQLGKAPLLDLALYFWYLRATTANLVVALVLSVALLWFRFSHDAAQGVVPTLVGLAIAAFLFVQARSFDAAMRRAAKLAAASEPDHNAPV